MWTRNYADGAVRRDDANLTFPEGCEAQVSGCNPFYPNEPRTFVCSVSETDQGWSELL
jgi:hypothetical protein